jgi:hypothetical protein
MNVVTKKEAQDVPMMAHSRVINFISTTTKNMPGFPPLLILDGEVQSSVGFWSSSFLLTKILIMVIVHARDQIL